MQPLSFDIRRYYRKHATGEVVSATGAVTATYAVDGPYKIAFRPGGKSRTQGEAGYTVESTVMYCIADGCHVFEAGDILTSDPQGQLEQWKIETVKDFPTEQTFYARGLRMPDDWDGLDAKLERLAQMADIIEDELAPQVCNLMRNTAVAMITNVWGAVDTGALRNSIEGVTQLILREDDATVEMGITATSDHLRYVEFGTGAKGSAEYTSPVTGESYTAEGVTFQTEKARWFQHNPDYQGVFGENNDPNGVDEWIPRYAQHPRPIMRPALYDNISAVKEMMESALAGAFE